jgi:hypothetical protein
MPDHDRAVRSADLTGAVSRAIIDEDNLQVRKNSLCSKSSEAAIHPGCAIE